MGLNKREKGDCVVRILERFEVSPPASGDLGFKGGGSLG